MADIILRLAAAFAFIYPALDEVADPTSWLGYVPHAVLNVTQAVGIPDLVFLHTFGALEILIALWLISGWKVVWPALAATAILVAIVILDGADFQILFRDLSIAGMTLAVALMHLPRGKAGWPIKSSLATEPRAV
ncbi:MAG: hypothetical protein V4474_03985 [Patescibacteria group bacterium]